MTCTCAIIRAERKCGSRVLENTYEFSRARSSECVPLLPGQAGASAAKLHPFPRFCQSALLPPKRRDIPVPLAPYLASCRNQIGSSPSHDSH